MTRRQVARRLGKSLTTIRRIEGVLLHPDVDRRGVHRFDPVDVEALANDVDSGRTVLGQQLRPVTKDVFMANTDVECLLCAELRDELDALRGQLNSQRADHHRIVAALKAEHDRERVEQDDAARDLMAQVAELMATLEG